MHPMFIEVRTHPSSVSVIAPDRAVASYGLAGTTIYRRVGQGFALAATAVSLGGGLLLTLEGEGHGRLDEHYLVDKVGNLTVTSELSTPTSDDPRRTTRHYVRTR